MTTNPQEPPPPAGPGEQVPPDAECERCGGKENLIESGWMKGLYFCRECWKERGRVNRAYRGGYEDELSEE